MDSSHQTTREIDPSRLRDLTGRFITRSQEERAERRVPLKKALDRFRSFDWPVYIFGGTIRDIATYGAKAVPRDLDLVVDGIDTQTLAETLSDLSPEINRFGGLSVDRGVRIDIWPLHETWALKQDDNFTPNIENLPKTTFLNVEAVAIRVDTTRGHAREIHENGFLDALNRQVLDVNYEPNPYPNSCVIRSLVTSQKLGFSLSPRLCNYIVDHTSDQKISELIAFQRAHYGRVELAKGFLNRWLREVRAHVESNSTSPFKPSSIRSRLQGHLWAGQQLDLWNQIISLPE